MALYDPVNGVYRKVAKMYDPVSGVYRNVTKAFDPVDGVYRQYFSGGTPVGSLAVGDSVWLNVNGVQTEFLVVHQGNPDSSQYDASCDGTWLLMKDLYGQEYWRTSTAYSDNDYQNSNIHQYLNNTFLALLDSAAQSAIKQVRIPYWNGTGTSGSAATGADGLSTNVFLLAIREVVDNTDHGYYGACLDYFSGTSEGSSTLKAYYSGTAKEWALRSINIYSTNYACSVTTTGGLNHANVVSNYRPYVRPAFILDSNTPFAQADGKNIIE